MLDYLAGIQHRPVITIDVDKPTSGEQRNIWENALGSVTSDLNSNVDALVSQYSMSLPGCWLFGVCRSRWNAAERLPIWTAVGLRLRRDRVHRLLVHRWQRQCMGN